MDNTNELLQYALDTGIISLEDMRTKIIMNKREEAKKLHKYAITPPSKEGGRYSTWVPEPDAPNGRRKIRKTKLEDLEDELVKIYIDKNNYDKKKMTLKDIYPDWLKDKYKSATSEGTAKRHAQHYRKYYMNSTIVSIPLSQLTTSEITGWFNALITKEGLTKKELNNMRVILTGCLEFAVEKKIISESPYCSGKINTRKCTTVNKKDNKSQVFLDSEFPLLKEHLLKEFENNPDCTDPLAILLNFYLGLRIGELVALKWSDIQYGYINIQRMEVRQESMNEDLSWNIPTRQIVNHTKANKKENDNRLIYLTKDALTLLKMVSDCNIRNGYEDNNFIFVNKDGRRKSTGIAYKLKKYCKAIGIKPKSSHKIRKTVASTLNANGMPLDEIRKMLGHHSESTTLGYLYNPFCDETTQNLYESALSYKKMAPSGPKAK